MLRGAGGPELKTKEELFDLGWTCETKLVIYTEITLVLERRKANRVVYSKNDVVVALSEGNDEPERIVLEIPGRSFNSPSVHCFSTFEDLFKLKVSRL